MDFFKQYLNIIIVAAITMGVAALGGYIFGLHNEINKLTVALDKEKLLHAQDRTAWITASQAAEVAERQKEREREDKRAKEIEDANKRTAQIERNLAAANTRLAGLQRAAREAATAARARGTGKDQAPPTGGTTETDPIGVFADVLGKCGERVIRLAEELDRSRSAGLACESIYGSLTDVTKYKLGGTAPSQGN